MEVTRENLECCFTVGSSSVAFTGIGRQVYRNMCESEKIVVLCFYCRKQGADQGKRIVLLFKKKKNTSTNDAAMFSGIEVTS